MPIHNNEPTPRYRAFLVKTLGPTNNKPTKVQITDKWHGTRRTFSYNHTGPRESLDQAELFLAGLGIKCCGLTCTVSNAHYDTLLTDDFETKIALRKVKD